MTNWIPGLLALAPLTLALVGLVPKRPSVLYRALPSVAIGAAGFGLGSVLVGTFLFFTSGASGQPAIVQPANILGLRITLYVDALSVLMTVLVAGVGTAVIHYSRRYLHGEARQPHFTRWLCLTLAAVLALILSGNLLQFTLAWIATSLCLHQLLVYYHDRYRARLAARKKFMISRLGDVSLAAAIAILFFEFGTLDFASLFSAARNLQEAASIPSSVHWATALLVGSALLKSAQLPFHGWLTEVMETPTPVSALLHAGIINAGGFLVLRFSDLVVLSPAALATLVVAGAATALFAALVMLTQTSIKVGLAWSTIAQMGFMMLQCGLGAFSAAMLHICAHSLYKAYAFLSSGSVIEAVRANDAVRAEASSPLRTGLALATAAVIVTLVGLPFDITLKTAPGPVVLAAILAMGVAQFAAAGFASSPGPLATARRLALITAVVVLYFMLQLGATALLDGALAQPVGSHGPFDVAAAVVVIAAFAGVLLLQQLGPPRSLRSQALYVHALNGFYLNTVTTRLIERVWPVNDTSRSEGVSA